MEHAPSPSPERDEAEPESPRPIFDLTQLSPVEIEQLIQAVWTADENPKMPLPRDTAPETYHLVLDDLLKALGRSLDSLPAVDIDKANEVYTHLVRSKQDISQNFVSDHMDTLLRHHLGSAEGREHVIKLWGELLDDWGSSAGQGASDAMVRAIESDWLDLPTKQRFYYGMLPRADDMTSEPK